MSQESSFADKAIAKTRGAAKAVKERVASPQVRARARMAGEEARTVIKNVDSVDDLKAAASTLSGHAQGIVREMLREKDPNVIDGEVISSETIVQPSTDSEGKK